MRARSDLPGREPGPHPAPDPILPQLRDAPRDFPIPGGPSPFQIHGPPEACGQNGSVTEEERALAARAARGDREAFSALYERSWPAVYAFVLPQVGDWDEARAVAQEAFLRAWTGIAGLREPERFGAWIRTIARNEIGHWRERASTRAAARSVPVEAAADRPDPASPDPGREAERREFEAILREELEALPLAGREAALLRIVGGLEYDEIAAQLGIGRNQAKGLAMRGIAQICERMERRYGRGREGQR